MNTADEQTTFTEQEIGKAYLFLNAIKLDTSLRAEWQAHLKSTKNNKPTPKQKVQYLNNFLTENGFHVSAKTVLHVLQTPWWKAYIASIKSNASSDEFVQRLLQDPKLFSTWNHTISKDPLQANQLLKKLGFKCNIQEVAASFTKMRRQKLTFWTGIYGKVIMIDKKGKKTDKNPALVIYKDHVSIGPDTIFGWTYKNGQLTWPLTNDQMPFPNNCSGTITFSEVVHPKKKGGYTGHIFSGILDYSDNIKGSDKVYNYEGQVGDPISAVPYSFRPGSPKNKTAAKISFIVGMALAGLITVSVLVPFVVTVVKWKKKRDKEKAEEENASKSKESEKSGDSGNTGDSGNSGTSDTQSEIKITLEDGTSANLPAIGEPPALDLDAIMPEDELITRFKKLRENTTTYDQQVQEGENPLGELQTKTPEQLIRESLEADMKDSPSPEMSKKIEGEIQEAKNAEEIQQEQANEDEMAEGESYSDTVEFLEQE